MSRWKWKPKRRRLVREAKKKAAERKPKPLMQKIQNSPLTSEETLTRTRLEINAINRRRAKDMERRVARYLRGVRVPSSGAIQGMKGDCKIPLTDGKQHYYVECKMTAQEAFPVSMKWFDKILVDTISMNARFGILVIHYHGKKQDYVFVPDKAMSFLALRSPHGFTIDLIRNDIIPRDITMVGNKRRSVLKLYEEQIIQSFVDVRGFRVTAFLMPSSGAWYVFTLEQFRDLTENV